MRRRYFIFRRSTFTLLLVVLICSNTGFTEVKLNRPGPAAGDPPSDLYEDLNLGKLGLKRQPFEQALKGLQDLAENGRVARTDLISIADFSRSANEKRLYIIDLAKKLVLFHTYVSHGRNTGNEYARSFGNENGSFKSSLGFYSTGKIYQGEHGTSLRLNGMESGINDKALERGIVIHGASYVSEDFIARNGRLGRSHGCPAVPEPLCESIVHCIKNGTCLFIYSPDSTYFGKSRVFSEDTSGR